MFYWLKKYQLVERRWSASPGNAGNFVNIVVYEGNQRGAREAMASKIGAARLLGKPITIEAFSIWPWQTEWCFVDGALLLPNGTVTTMQRSVT